MFAVGVTPQVDAEFLAALSGDAGGVAEGDQMDRYDYFLVPDFTSLNAVYQNVSSQICYRSAGIATRTGEFILRTTPWAVQICPLICSCEITKICFLKMPGCLIQLVTTKHF